MIQKKEAVKRDGFEARHVVVFIENLISCHGSKKVALVKFLIILQDRESFSDTLRYLWASLGSSPFRYA